MKKIAATKKVAPPKRLDHAYILDFIERYATEAFSFKVLARRLDIITREEKMELAEILQKLVDNEGIAQHTDGSFQSVNGLQYLVGDVHWINAKFAYIKVEGEAEEIRVSSDDLGLAFDGDTVRVRLFGTRRGGKPEGQVVEVVKRRREVFVGKIEVQRNYAFVIPDNKRTYVDIFVSQDQLNGALHHDKVKVKITDWGSFERNPVGEVIEVLGQAGENDTEMHAILAEFGLPLNFPQEVLDDTNKISHEISAEEIAKRRDFRGITTFTIDPIDAKDFDDALSIHQLENGNWEVGIHIADVTYYVLNSTALEAEAQERATSVYLVDRTVPMLPEVLSNQLCSLRPREDKLTFSAVFELDTQGHVKEAWYGRTIIHSQHRFTYEEAQEILDNGSGSFADELTVLNKLALKLRKARFRSGSIGFETPEVKFVLDQSGRPLAVVPKVRKDAHKLIEEFMLLANKKVAEFIYQMRKGRQKNTFVYRIHDEPDLDRLRVFAAFARKLGYKMDIENEEISDALNSLIDSTEGQPESNVLQNLAVRTMAKAKYSTDNVGHFGLAFNFYTHFTSPIRRYPDMMVHRLLQHYLDGGDPVDAVELERLCKWSSDRERVAAEAERASIKYKQVEFMMLQKANKVYDGIVSGVTEWGFYVEITETKCEGLVRISDLHDDFYELDSENYRLVGKRSNRIIAFGDHLEVKVKSLSLEKRTIDLMLVDEDLARYATMRRNKPAANNSAIKRKARR